MFPVRLRYLRLLAGLGVLLATSCLSVRLVDARDGHSRTPPVVIEDLPDPSSHARKSVIVDVAPLQRLSADRDRAGRLLVPPRSSRGRAIKPRERKRAGRLATRPGCRFGKPRHGRRVPACEACSREKRRRRALWTRTLTQTGTSRIRRSCQRDRTSASPDGRKSSPRFYGLLDRAEAALASWRRGANTRSSLGLKGAS